MKKIRFDPGNLTYELASEKKGVFEKRNIASYPINEKAKAKLLTIKAKFYDLLFSNQKKSYLSRNLTYSKILPPTTKKEGFVGSDELIGSEKQIYFNSRLFLTELISNLVKKPQTLFLEADRITDICKEVNYEIPIIQAFNQISSWNEFISLLESINDNKEYRFEFAISAIIQYAKLCKR